MHLNCNWDITQPRHVGTPFHGSICFDINYVITCLGWYAFCVKNVIVMDLSINTFVKTCNDDFLETRMWTNMYNDIMKWMCCLCTLYCKMLDYVIIWVSHYYNWRCLYTWSINMVVQSINRWDERKRKRKSPISCHLTNQCVGN
jgi:hypothetical protein